MKNVILTGLLTMLVVGMSSCTKTQVINPNNWQIVDCSIGYSQWRYSGDDATHIQYDNNYFYAGCNIPQLTNLIFTDGNVQVYLVEKNSYGEDMQRPLPFTRHFETWRNDSTFYHTETYDYFYGVGWIEFNYTASDFAYEQKEGTQFRPGSKEFRVVFTW